jgi:hypothetical protein
MGGYEVHVWADGGEEPAVTAYDLLEDARAALKRALEDDAPRRVDVVNPDGIVIESAER